MSGGRLLLFGGTTEAREILARGVPALCCVATEYGAALAEEGISPKARVRVGRLDAEGIANLIAAEGVVGVIDATHPYAVEVTKNVRAACERTGTPLLRVLREATSVEDRGVIRVASCREAAELLNAREGEKAFLTVGSKELGTFTAVRDYERRLFARVLPTSEVLRACEALGFDPAHVIAMQGPFSAGMNRAMLEMTGASLLVTKDGGGPGGMEAKLDGARAAGAEVILVARPEDAGCSVGEAVLWARRMLGLGRPPLFPLMKDIEGLPVLVAGGGTVARRRAETLLRCGARVRAVSPAFREGFPHELERLCRPFEPGDLEGAVLAVAAADDREVNRRVGQEAQARGIPVSVADAAGESTFFFPSLVAEGPVAASVSSAGLSCALTRRLSDRLRSVWGAWVAEEEAELERARDSRGPREEGR